MNPRNFTHAGLMAAILMGGLSYFPGGSDRMRSRGPSYKSADVRQRRAKNKAASKSRIANQQKARGK